MGSTQPQYSNLLVLVRALLALPASNADSFSMIRKIDGEKRNLWNALIFSQSYHLQIACEVTDSETSMLLILSIYEKSSIRNALL